jgi:Tfp pilus assembly protein PilF
MRVKATLIGCALVLYTGLSAQQPRGVPRRPALDATRDTNSASDYYNYGISQLRSNPTRAAAAFYWATQLDPGMAEPWYGRWAASLLAEETRVLGDYFAEKAYITKSREIQQIDSMRYQAMIRDPLLYWHLDQFLLDEWLARVSGGEVTLNMVAHDYGPELAGWWAYGQGQFVEALKQYAVAIRQNPKWYGLRLERARAFLPLRQYDSAAAAYAEVLKLEGGREAAHVVHVYDSKEIAYFTIGRIREAQGNVAAAQEAYGQALVENLAFYPAHAALARVALATGDTAGAVREYDQALQLHPDAPGVRHDYGIVLFALKRYDAATEQFQLAVDEDPYFARPYFPLAVLRENEGKDSVAVAHYRRFIQIAPASLAAQVKVARQRLGEQGTTPR